MIESYPRKRWIQILICTCRFHRRNFNLHLPFPKCHRYGDSCRRSWLLERLCRGGLHFVVYLNHSAKLAGWFFHHQRGYAKNAYLLQCPFWAIQRAESGTEKPVTGNKHFLKTCLFCYWMLLLHLVFFRLNYSPCLIKGSEVKYVCNRLFVTI